MVLEEKEVGKKRMLIVLAICCSAPICVYLLHIFGVIDLVIFWRGLDLQKLVLLFIVFALDRVCILAAIVSWLILDDEGLINAKAWFVAMGVKVWSVKMRILKILLKMVAYSSPTCVLIWAMRDLWTLYPGAEFWENLPEFYPMIAFLGISQTFVVFLMLVWRGSERIKIEFDDEELEGEG
jgi:hypothetical protein